MAFLPVPTLECYDIIFMLVFLIIIFVLFLIWPWIKQPVSNWFSRFMANRTEDMMRRMMGMPSRKEERKRQKQAAKNNKGRRGAYRRQQHTDNRKRTASLMREVAVDVEYTEVKEFSSTTILQEDRQGSKVIIEEQITDAEYIEIRK